MSLQESLLNTNQKKAPVSAIDGSAQMSVTIIRVSKNKQSPSCAVNSDLLHNRLAVASTVKQPVTLQKSHTGLLASKTTSTNKPQRLARAKTLQTKTMKTPAFPYHYEKHTGPVEIHKSKPMNYVADISDNRMICRVCGEYKDDAIYIYSREGRTMELDKKIHRFLPIQVRVDDDLPLFVCGVCKASLKQSQALFEICKRADKILHNSKGITQQVQFSPALFDIQKKSNQYKQMKSAVSMNYKTSILKTQVYPQHDDICKTTLSEDISEDISEYIRSVSPIDEISEDYHILSPEGNNPELSEHGFSYVELNEPELNYSKLSDPEFQDSEVSDPKYCEHGFSYVELNEPGFSYVELSEPESISDIETQNETKPLKFPTYCTICDRQLRSANLATKHCLQFHQKHICVYCGKLYKKLDNITKHHTQRHTHKCPTCDIVILGSTITVQNHVAQHTAETFNCKICDVKSLSKQHLNVHYTSVHSKFTCLKCMTIFENEKSLTDHASILKHGYWCVHCKIFFLMRSSLRSHLLQKHKEKLEDEKDDGVYDCTICNISYSKLLYLKSHYMHFHSVFMCHVCQEIFNTHDSVNNHCLEVHGHSSDWQFECKNCGKYFDVKNNLKLHLQNKHAQSGGHLCDLCGKSCKREIMLRKHMSNAHGIFDKDLPPDKFLTCDQCGFKFPNKFKILLHIKRHFEIKDVICNICDSKFYDTSGLKEHTRKVHQKNIPCSVCHKLFHDEKSLSYHMDRNHVSEFTYTCNLCSHFYKSKVEFHQHYNKDHDSDTSLEQINERFYKLTSPHQCTTCSMYLPSKATLKLHVNRRHKAKARTKKVSSYSVCCKNCPETFNCSRKLADHMYSKHGVSRQFPCTQCHRSYHKNESLILHIKKFHTTLRPYACDVCSSTYRTKKQVAHHKRRVHFANRSQHVCQYCNFGFKDNGALTKHLKLHTGVDKNKYQCHICDCYLSKKFALDKHLLRHQNNLIIRNRATKFLPAVSDTN